VASISNDPNGRRRILFVDGDGGRKTIRLGKCSQRHAESVKVKVEDLVSAKFASHAPSDETSRWLAGLDDTLHKRIAAAGLAKPRGTALLGSFTREYIDGRADLKPSSRINMDRARKYLLEVFDAKMPMRDFTEGDAEDWQQAMIRAGRASNTIRKAAGRVRQFFNAAKRRGLVSFNPFDFLPATVQAVHERFHFVSREDARRVLDACPDVQWRVIFSLARYGGLRCPSEIMALTWGDVDWDRGRIRIPSPKTAGQGKASRTIPMFPELRPILMDAFDEAEEGAEYVVSRRDTNANLRTQLHRIIRKAGLEPWPKTFQNLRSTRETELAETYPLHVVCGWIGNSQPVAAKHYLQLTDEHFTRALGDAETEAAQNAAQQAHASKRTDVNSANDDHAKTPAKARVRSTSHDDARTCKSGKVPEEGLEPSLVLPNRILNPARLPIPPLRQECLILPSISCFCRK
jgi:integrase